MPDIESNRAVWTSGWDWSTEGDEWSSWWGGTEAMWHGALLPRIHAFVPTNHVLEIGPGYGRWTQYLKDLCDHLTVVDLAANCIEHCRDRFGTDANIEYHVNDGRSLDMVADGSVDFAFTFDSLVHVDPDVVADYLVHLGRTLAPDGIAFVHHSNLGAYRRARTLARRTPARLMRPLMRRGILVDLFAWRDEALTAEGFVDLCRRAELVCVGQERIAWQSGRYLLDALSLVARQGSRWDRPLVTAQNRASRAEAARMSRLYSARSFPGPS